MIPKNGFSSQTTKIELYLPWKRRRYKLTKNQNGDITINLRENKNTMTNYVPENSDEIDIFLEKHKSPTLTQEEIFKIWIDL